MATLGRHSESESGALLTWIPRIIFSYVALVMIAGGLTLIWILMGSGSDGSPRNPAAVSLPSGTPPDPAPTGRGKAATPKAGGRSDLVANARKIKPLEDIEKGDRVLFRGRVCTWQLWSKNINTSIIKCPGRELLQTQTARLTPVELRKSTDQ